MAQAFVLGNSGASIPSGGTKGAVLTKNSEGNFDMIWGEPNYIPNYSSENRNQVLKIDENGNLGWDVATPTFSKGEVNKVLKIELDENENPIQVWGDGLPANGETGQILVKTEQGYGWSNSSNKIKTTEVVAGIDDDYYITGVTAAGDADLYTATMKTTTNNSLGIYFNGKTGVLRGAAWNDYAEFRLSDQKIKPGTCVIENGDDKVRESDIDMAGCAYIVSDTYGMAIGEEEGTVPVALSGKVLAYTEEPQELYRKNIGRPVCASVNGKIRLMTSEEAKEKPWCILGVVSSVPNYNVWGITFVEVDGRVWIKVK